jgi:DNA polymerase-4
MPTDHKRWNRIIAHVDMDAFFASIEQKDQPDYRNKPIGIINNESGTTIITASYEARAFGIKTGMHIKRALALCPNFIAVVSRPHRYAEMSTRFLLALQDITPDIEVFSIDEAFLDLTHCKYLYRYPKEVALRIKDLVFSVAGVTCSVGISGDKSTAKFASKLNKPNGITIIPPWLARDTLAPYPVRLLCGVGNSIERFLEKYAVKTCGDMQYLPVSVLSSRYGNVGRRIWLMAQGLDNEPLNLSSKQAQSMSSSKIIPPNTKDVSLLDSYLYYCCDKVATRLRSAQLFAKRVRVLIHLEESVIAHQADYSQATQDERRFYATAKETLNQWRGQGVYKISVCADLLTNHAHYQRDLFEEKESEHDRLNAIKDRLNQRFGDGTVKTAKLLLSPKMSEVIPPSWKPEGSRNCVKSQTQQKGDGQKKM